MATHTDPICGMQVDYRDARERSEYAGRTYFFCSEECKTTFDRNPEVHAGTPDASAPSDNRR